MIRICYIVDSPYAGGAERYISLLVDHLDRRLFEPSLIVKQGAGIDAWCNSHAREGVRVTRVPMNLPFRPHHVFPVVRAIREHAPHIAHVNMPGPYTGQTALLVPLARASGALCCVTTEHLPMVERLWKRALVKQLSYPWVDRVFTICNANVPYLRGRQRVPSDKISVVYNGLPASFGAGDAPGRREARRHYELGDGTVAIAVIGSLIRRKGAHLLFEALAGVTHGDWRLLLAGSGEDRKFFEERVRELDLRERVRFLGDCSMDDIVTLLSAVDILALPSFMEGMPYVILEAMAFSLPVVATRVNGIPEAAVDGETAILTPPGDSVALRVALNELMDDAPRRHEMGRLGRKRFDELFTLQDHIGAMEKSYRQLLGLRP